MFEDAGGEVDVHDVPGAFELPLAAKYCAESGRYAGVACLGAVIRGETDHYDYVCARGRPRASRASRSTPACRARFGVLTVDNMEQALARAGGGKRHQGEDAARRGARAGRAQEASGVGQGRRDVNLFSDTQTRPSPGMRQAMADGRGGGRAARSRTRRSTRLQERVAELLGHEAAALPADRARCATRSPSGCTSARAATR